MRKRLNIDSLKEDKRLLLFLNKNYFKALKHSEITIDEKGISTNAGTKKDSAVQYRDSLVISTLMLNLLMFIIDKWDSVNEECKEFIENNLEMLTNYMEEK